LRTICICESLSAEFPESLDDEERDRERERERDLRELISSPISVQMMKTLQQWYNAVGASKIPISTKIYLAQFDTLERSLPIFFT